MTKQLNLDEMLEVCLQLNSELGDIYQKLLETIGTQMADYIAAKLDVKSDAATFQGTGFAGTCAPFWPKYPGQECPEALKPYDPQEWDDDEELYQCENCGNTLNNGSDICDECGGRMVCGDRSL